MTAPLLPAPKSIHSEVVSRMLLTPSSSATALARKVFPLPLEPMINELVRGQTGKVWRWIPKHALPTATSLSKACFWCSRIWCLTRSGEGAEGMREENWSEVEPRGGGEFLPLPLTGLGFYFLRLSLIFLTQVGSMTFSRQCHSSSSESSRITSSRGQRALISVSSIFARKSAIGAGCLPLQRV